MNRFSYNLPKHPVNIRHTECGRSWDMYAIEWPPKIVFCTHCGICLKLVGHDKKTQRFTYRRI